MSPTSSTDDVSSSTPAPSSVRRSFSRTGFTWWVDCSNTPKPQSTILLDLPPTSGGFDTPQSHSHILRRSPAANLGWHWPVDTRHTLSQAVPLPCMLPARQAAGRCQQGASTSPGSWPAACRASTPQGASQTSGHHTCDTQPRYITWAKSGGNSTDTGQCQETLRPSTSVWAPACSVASSHRRPAAHVAAAEVLALLC